MSTKKQRRINAALRRKELENKINAQSAVTQGNNLKAANDESDYENAVANSYELAENCVFDGSGTIGPDIPEPKDYEPY